MITHAFLQQGQREDGAVRTEGVRALQPLLWGALAAISAAIALTACGESDPGGAWSRPLEQLDAASESIALPEAGAGEASADAPANADADAAPASDAPQIETTSLPVAGLKDAYEAVIQASGDDTGSFTWSVVSGALPDGLTLQAAALQAELVGVPSAAGTFGFTVRIQDSQGQFDEQALELTVRQPEWLVYRADEDQGGVFELYAVDVSKEGPPARIKLNAPLPDGADVSLWGYGPSYDGKYFAYTVQQPTTQSIYVMDVSGATPGEPIEVGLGGQFWGWSSSADVFMVEMDDDSIYLVDATTTPPTKTLVAPGAAGSYSRSFSPDGKRFVYNNSDCASLTVLDVKQPSVQHKLVPNATGVCQYSYFADDSRHIYLVDFGAGSLYVADSNLIPGTLKTLDSGGYHHGPAGPYPSVFYQGPNDLRYKNADLNDPPQILEVTGQDQGLYKSPSQHTIAFASTFGVVNGAEWKVLDSTTHQISSLHAQFQYNSYPWLLADDRISLRSEDTDGTQKVLYYKKYAQGWPAPWELNDSKVVGSKIVWMTYAQDLTAMLYAADELTPGLEELFYVDLRDALPRKPIRIPMPPTQGLYPSFYSHFAWSPDSKRFVFAATQANYETPMYLVDASKQAPSAPVRINGVGQYTGHVWVPRSH